MKRAPFGGANWRESDMARVGFIGTGTIAEPMIRALTRRGHHIAISQRSEFVSGAASQRDRRWMPE